MNAMLMHYYDAVDWPDPVRRRLREISPLAEEYCPETISRIFLSETINSEEERDYQSAWFLSPNYALEFFDPIPGGPSGTPARFDVTPMSGRVARAEFTVRQFNSGRGSASSRLTVDFATKDLVTGVLRASGTQNCRWLRQIVDDFILPWVSGSALASHGGSRQ